MAEVGGHDHKKRSGFRVLAKGDERVGSAMTQYGNEDLDVISLRPLTKRRLLMAMRIHAILSEAVAEAAKMIFSRWRQHGQRSIVMAYLKMTLIADLFVDWSLVFAMRRAKRTRSRGSELI